MKVWVGDVPLKVCVCVHTQAHMCEHTQTHTHTGPLYLSAQQPKVCYPFTYP